MAMTSLDDAAWGSPWRHRRVGEKVMLTVTLLLSGLLAPAWPGTVLVAAAACVVMLGWAKIPAQALATAMAAPALFVVLGAGSVAVQVGVPGSGPVSVSDASVRAALTALGRGTAGSTSLMVLATTTPMVDLLAWLRRLRVPDALLEVASLTYRMLFVALAAALGIREAQAARLGTAPGQPLRRRLDAAASAAGSVLVRTWERSRRLEDGLVGRGYCGALTTLEPRRAASPALVLASPALAALVWGGCLVVAGVG